MAWPSLIPVIAFFKVTLNLLLCFEIVAGRSSPTCLILTLTFCLFPFFIFSFLLMKCGFIIVISFLNNILWPSGAAVIVLLLRSFFATYHFFIFLGLSEDFESSMPYLGPRR